MLEFLIAGDIRKCRQMWAEKMPNMPQPTTDGEAEIVMHQARTMMKMMPVKLRMWSHRWLKERGILSHLPHDLIDKAERIEIVDAHTVGISVASMVNQPAADTIRRAMESVAMDALSGKKLPDRDILRKALDEARDRETRRLFD